MASVAIIHAAEDALPARALAEKLRQAKLTVILEKTGEELRNAVKDAKVTVALWSPRSVTQPGLVEDTTFAKGKSKVIHALMQNAAAPEAFRSEKTVVNLTGWRGEDDFPAWRELAKLVTDRAGVAAIPPPAPKPPSGFFQPGVVREAQPAGASAAQARSAPQRQAAPPPRPQQTAPRPASAPPPRAPASAPRVAEPAREKSGGGGRMVMIAIVTFIVVALLGGGGYYFWNQSQNADATALAWQAVDQNSASALRNFIDGDPGDYLDDAQQALAQLEERSFEAASDADSIEALEAFLNDFPQSTHAVAVRGRIAELQLAQPATPVDPNAVDPNAPTTSPDPDLVPPGSTAPAPAPTTGGPAPITPPAETPAEEPAPTP